MTASGFVLGLTGGIATGKSTAVEVFREHHIPIVDGDIIAREVVEPGTPGLLAIVTEFGTSILQEDGSLDRKKLGTIIFRSEEARHRLNQILNPFIRKEIKKQIETLKKTHPLVVADIPLLYEGHYDHYMDAVAVVYTTEAVQLERLMNRNQLTIEEAQQRIKSQFSIEQKKKAADILFDNNGTKDQLKKQIEDWLSQQSNRFL